MLLEERIKIQSMFTSTVAKEHVKICQYSKENVLDIVENSFVIRKVVEN
jgi:hypothetical protein